MKVNALIIDDNPADRYVLKRWLAKCDFDAYVEEVSDGQHAIDYFNGTSRQIDDGYPPEIIFLDINMPRMNGFEFLEAFRSIRERDHLESTVIVMFTSSPREDDRDHALSWDFVSSYIVKGSYDTDDLERLVTEGVSHQLPEVRKAAS